MWQVSGRSETTFDERAYLDAWYIKNWTLWYDIVILLLTVKVVLRREGAY
ncbi:MAG: sugar transferase [Acidithiobacillus ferrooxidans]